LYIGVFKIKEMKIHKAILFMALATTFASCWKSKNDSESYFSVDKSKVKDQYTTKESILFGLKNLENKKIDSVVYYMDNKNIGSKKGIETFSISLKDEKFGDHSLKAIVYFEGVNQEISSKIEVISYVEPKLLKYTVVNIFPHDTATFTEGLEFYNGILYESSGLYKKSKLLKTDYKTGKILDFIKLDDKYFGEGITILKDKIYQLTWQEKTGFIYDAKTFKLEKTFKYDGDQEGWGMTNDGTYIYHNDSTESIWRMNPDTQKMIDKIKVYSSDAKVIKLNELEWIDGKIYSNIWQKDAIVVINSSNGAVEGILNFADLRAKYKIPVDDVLNGIAYNSKTKTIFVTGKNWNKMFEIKVSE
jgi:glutaminyl-peptide cyclotransferase